MRIARNVFDLLAGKHDSQPRGADIELSEDDLRRIAARVHDRPDELIDVYRASRPDASRADLRIALLGDGVFGRVARSLAASHGAAHEYEFTWRSDTVGAAHATELPFVFDVADLPALHGPHGLLGATPPPADLAARMHAAWIRFATTGDPGWPASRPGHRVVQRIGAEWQLTENPRPAENAVWR